MKKNCIGAFQKLLLPTIIFVIINNIFIFSQVEANQNLVIKPIFATADMVKIGLFSCVAVAILAFAVASCCFKRFYVKLQKEREEAESARKTVLDLCESLSVVVFKSWSTETGDCGFSYFSPQLHQMFGVKPEELMKNSNAWHQYLYKTNPDEVNQFLYEHMCIKQTPFHFELQLMLKGSEHWLSISLSPMSTEGDKTYWSGHIEDVTQRKKAELALQTSEQRFELMAENMQEVFWLQDAKDGQMLYVSPAYEKIWGLPNAELHHSVEAVVKRIVREDRVLVVSQFRYQRSGQITYYEFRIVLPDGSIRWIANRAYPVVDEETGEVQYIVGMAVDISQQKALEDDLMQTMQDAETAYRAKSDFLSRVSHEIRTPMNAIIGMTQLARQTADVDKIKTYLDHVEISTKHLLRLINDILDLSRIEAGKMQIVEETFDFFNTMHEALCVVGSQAEQKKQHFEADLDKEIPAYLLGDALRLTQIVVNLLSNAVKFTPEYGSIVFRVQCMEKTVERILLKFTIIDTGIGISKQNMDKLFEPFEQADGSVSRRFGGSGLGLAISQSLVKVMGGEITVKSVLDQGSEFEFCLWFHTEESKKDNPVPVAKSISDDEFKNIGQPEGAIHFTKGLVHAAGREKVYHKMLEGFSQSDLVKILKDQIEAKKTEEAIKTAQGLRSVANHLGIDEVARLSGLILSELSVGLSTHTNPLMKKLEEAMCLAQASIVQLLDSSTSR